MAQRAPSIVAWMARTAAVSRSAWGTNRLWPSRPSVAVLAIMVVTPNARAQVFMHHDHLDGAVLQADVVRPAFWFHLFLAPAFRPKHDTPGWRLLPGPCSSALLVHEPQARAGRLAGDLEQHLLAHRIGEMLIAGRGDHEAARAADNPLRECRLEVIADRPAGAVAAEDRKAVDHDVGGQGIRARLRDRQPVPAVGAVGGKVDHLAITVDVV